MCDIFTHIASLTLLGEKGENKMANEGDGKSTEKFVGRFAEVAVKMNFIKPEQAKEAITEQLKDNLNNRPHRLIGRILMDKGWMTPKQLDLVLTELLKRQRYS